MEVFGWLHLLLEATANVDAFRGARPVAEKEPFVVESGLGI
jgi:hypothetical protein